MYSPLTDWTGGRYKHINLVGIAIGNGGLDALVQVRPPHS
jgi:hypothetical protein